jgi:hypothetical protein
MQKKRMTRFTVYIQIPCSLNGAPPRSISSGDQSYHLPPLPSARHMLSSCCTCGRTRDMTLFHSSSSLHTNGMRSSRGGSSKRNFTLHSNYQQLPPLAAAPADPHWKTVRTSECSSRNISNGHDECSRGAKRKQHGIKSREGRGIYMNNINCSSALASDSASAVSGGAATTLSAR